jgi:hypothetical protein
VDNINSVMNLYRNCNVLLRWYILHTSKIHLRKFKLILILVYFWLYYNIYLSTNLFINSVSASTRKSKIICDQVCKQSLFNEKNIFDLLITTSEFELKIKHLFKSVS